jgi:hypothetical protein
MDVLTVDSSTAISNTEAAYNVTTTVTTAAECVQSTVDESYMVVIYLIIGTLIILCKLYINIFIYMYDMYTRIIYTFACRIDQIFRHELVGVQLLLPCR